MTENRENWLYPDASGLYFTHDGFIMRATDGKQYDYEEECELLNEYAEENEQLKSKIRELKCELDSKILGINVFNAENSALIEENEQLKSKNRGLQSELEIFKEDVRHSNSQMNKLAEENEQLRKENEKLESLWEDKCVREYLTVCGESILKEMHDEKYGDKG